MIELTEYQKELGWKISTAHEFVQSLPLTRGCVECVACGVVTKIGRWDIQECSPHVVSEKSGW